MARRKSRPTGRRIDGTHYLAERTVCIRNHPLEGDNVIERRDRGHPHGGRMCRTCSRERAKLWSKVRYWSAKLKEHLQPSHAPCDECRPITRRAIAAQTELQKWRQRGRQD